MSQKSIMDSFRFRNRNGESGTSLDPAEVEREEKTMTWARISNPLTVQFAKILREKRRGRDLKKD